jgi:EthD domain
MIKVMWFLKRAEHLTLEQFHKWWVEVHAPMIVKAQRPHLKNYVVNLRWPSDSLPNKPEAEMDWDGCAEQWFENEADFQAVYGPPTPDLLRDDTLKHVSRSARMIVQGHSIALSHA